jgi:hypothetical protein
VHPGGDFQGQVVPVIQSFHCGIKILDVAAGFLFALPVAAAATVKKKTYIAGKGRLRTSGKFPRVPAVGG